MVCSCESRCTCEEHRDCCANGSGTVSHGKKTYSLYPICKANLADNSNKITLTSSTTTFSTGKGGTALIKMKSRKYNSSGDSIVPLLTTSYKSTLNDSKSQISENEQTKLPVKKESGMSRFNSLKQAMLKMRRRFKKPKIRKNDSWAFLATQRGHESTEESSVETASSKEADFSPGKRIKSLNSKSYSTENLLRYSSKAQNVSFFQSRSDQNIGMMSHAKSLMLNLNAEADSFQNPDSNLTGMSTDNLVLRTQSFLHIKDSSHSLQSCSAPLLFNINPLCASNNKKKGDTLSEDKKCKMINLKNSEKSTGRQFNISSNFYKPAIFKRNFFKSMLTSDNDKSITVPLYSGFRDELCSRQLCSYDQPLRSSKDKSNNTEILNCETDSQVTNSEVISELLNESPEALISPSRSTSHDKVETPHPFSHKSLHCSQSHQSLVRSFLELSLNETVELGNSDVQDHDITDVTTVDFVSSDVSDNFEIFQIRSSPDSTGSESISSSEFVPCSYCRFVTCIPPISDSVIPYETFE